MKTDRKLTLWEEFKAWFNLNKERLCCSQASEESIAFSAFIAGVSLGVSKYKKQKR